MPRSPGVQRAAEQKRGCVAGDVDPSDAAVILLATLFGLGMTSGTEGEGVAPDRIRSAVRALVDGNRVADRFTRDRNPLGPMPA